MKTLREWWKIEKEKRKIKKEQWKRLHIFAKCLVGGIIAFFIYLILTIGYDIIWPVY